MHSPNVKEEIIALLARHRQKATYGALADLTGGLPQGVMNEFSATLNNRWVVNGTTLMPAGYPSHLLDDYPNPGEEENPVVTDGDGLRNWIQAQDVADFSAIQLCLNDEH